MPMDCIFCKIINREIPASIIYESDEVLAFLDIHPTTKGHALVIPKQHSADFATSKPEVAGALAQATQQVATAVMTATGSQGFNININNGVVAGQVIFHVHWHIIPRYEGDGLRLWAEGYGYEAGEAASLAQQIKADLASK